ncbi:MAG: sigma-70 family RNA polymerase sigma factor [bacterium]|nr:MAG: sigma-70 family RNA polymerase sigma factor [bacterium]
MEKEEELLIRKAQRGNLQAFENLVHRYDAKIMRLIFNMVNDIEDTRDLYQEVFIKVFKSIKRFRFQSEFYTWLFRITVNTCINYRKRKTYYQHESLEDYLDETDRNWRIVGAIENRNPEQTLINKELNDQIRQSIDRLSSKQRSVFILKHYHGYKLSEIANIMNCSEGTVKNYMFRAVQKMKKSLAPYHQI